MKDRILIFGTGMYYKRRRGVLPEKAEIVGFLDNNSSVWGKLIDGIPVYSPTDISLLNEWDYIVLASAAWMEMQKQLQDLGVDANKIVFWDEYVCKNSHGVLKRYNTPIMSKGGYKILIIPSVINYAGGFMAAFHMALSLRKLGCEIVMASPVLLKEADDIVTQVNQAGISVWICPSLPYVEETELQWIREFDYVIANCLQNLILAERVSQYVPTMLWLHENSDQYEAILAQEMKEIRREKLKQVKVCAVSSIARENFMKYFPELQIQILPCGIIEDDNIEIKKNKEKDKITFAVIGAIAERKNQVSFVRALDGLSEETGKNIEGLIIGQDGSGSYKSKLLSILKDKTNIKMLGEYPHSQMKEVYNQIDVVVCTSTEETLSIVIAEGMMYGKIVITNDHTGIAEYIENGVSGFVYHEGDERQLRLICKQIVEEFDTVSMKNMRRNTRKAFEEQLSTDKFEDRIKRIIKIPG